MTGKHVAVHEDTSLSDAEISSVNDFIFAARKTLFANHGIQGAYVSKGTLELEIDGFVIGVIEYDASDSGITFTPGASV